MINLKWTPEQSIKELVDELFEIEEKGNIDFVDTTSLPSAKIPDFVDTTYPIWAMNDEGNCLVEWTFQNETYDVKHISSIMEYQLIKEYENELETENIFIDDYLNICYAEDEWGDNVYIQFLIETNEWQVCHQGESGGDFKSLEKAINIMKDILGK